MVFVFFIMKTSSFFGSDLSCRDLTFDFFKCSSFPFFESKANSTIEQQMCKITKSLTDFKFRKLIIIIRFPAK